MQPNLEHSTNYSTVNTYVCVCVCMSPSHTQAQRQEKDHLSLQKNAFLLHHSEVILIWWLFWDNLRPWILPGGLHSTKRTHNIYRALGSWPMGHPCKVAIPPQLVLLNSEEFSTFFLWSPPTTCDYKWGQGLKNDWALSTNRVPTWPTQNGIVTVALLLLTKSISQFLHLFYRLLWIRSWNLIIDPLFTACSGIHATNSQ